ncbi:RWP-RK domain-containing protein [Cephalotus follicularis]|uniref:RWP-RK domain-containing protein n=1 Tax=Cephalotus follicularis TaxID=3775 RepID=A0A1Q3CS35_CEPFO|nr:RWP-RK domain-containing protein [Cephalotus follicularis]
MYSPQTHSLKALLVFENTINKELIRSLHVYRLEDGKESEEEKEFVFKRDGSYVEMVATPLLRLQTCRVLELFQGQVFGLWVCILAFHLGHLVHIPPILSISRNPKLKSIPALAIDLQIIFKLSCRKTEDKEPPQSSSEEVCEGNGENYYQARNSLPDLNCLPYSHSTSELTGCQQIQRSAVGMKDKKKKRAATEDIDRIALEDLVKYFGLPIVEASRNLRVGVTVLKRKCREFGIPRWPHRKIKSLDSLIQNLQEEAERQEEDKAAVMAVAKRQRMLEKEKESIEKEPFTELQSETKKFRQDIFKRRHRARALKTQQDLSIT